MKATLRGGLVLLLACAAALAADVPASSPLGLWRVDQARSEPLYDRSRARLDFQPGGVLSGHTSCNSLQARYTLEGAVLRITALSAGSARCAPLLMEQEDRMLTALELATSARVRDDGLLELRDADGRGVLRGTRF